MIQLQIDSNHKFKSPKGRLKFCFILCVPLRSLLLFVKKTQRKVAEDAEDRRGKYIIDNIPLSHIKIFLDLLLIFL